MGRRKNDIERYLRGEMTSAEMHELEKEALSDPFLAEALEGIQQAGTDSFLFDLKELRSSFKHRSKHKPKIISMWNWSLGIAAGLVLLAASSIYIIININEEKRLESIAMKQNVGDKLAAPAEKNTLADSAALSQPNPNTPPQQSNPGTERTNAGPEKKTAQPIQNQPPASELTDSDEAEENQTKPAAQTETIEPRSQQIAETDITITSKDTVTAPAVRDRKSTAPARIIRGKVISEDDKVVIPGVNVLVKGTSRGTVTDINGSYEIAVDDPKQTLVFAFIGYKTAEVASENKTEMNVQLKTDNLALSEVVVAGYSGGNYSPTVELAAPKGGREAFQEYLKDNIRYPQTALRNKIEGRVMVQFTVNSSGQLNDFKVLKGIGSGCEEELLRLIQEGPAWSPTKQNNQPVNDKVKVRFRFDIPD